MFWTGEWNITAGKVRQEINEVGNQMCDWICAYL
jgi:hypothetical protein